MDPAPSLRSLIARTFNDEELRTFCFDHFPVVYDAFTTGMTKGQMIQLLLDHCMRRQAGEVLLTALERERPGLIGADRDALLAWLDPARLAPTRSDESHPVKPHSNIGDQTTGNSRIVNTSGGDYAEGNIDKRQGAFVEGTVYGTVIGQMYQQPEVSSFSEIDYRILLAQALRDSPGKLKFVSTEQLKAAQMRLRMTSERAEQLEREIRIALAEEHFNEIPHNAFECQSVLYDLGGPPSPPPVYSPLSRHTEALIQIGRVVLLHEETALQLLLERLPRQCPLDMRTFREAFLKANSVRPNKETFDRFLDTLAIALAQRP